MYFRWKGNGWPAWPQRAPPAFGRAVGILDRVQGVLHVLVQVGHLDELLCVLLLVAHAAIDDEQRLGVEVLAHLQVFVVA